MSVVAVLVLACAGSAPAAVSVGHSGWEWGNPLPQGNDVQGLEFLGNRGYAAGRFGTLLRTDDGGATWSGLATGITQDLARVRIIDPDSLVIAGGCALRRSDDAGESFRRLPWTASDLNCPAPIVSLSFPSDSVGYLALTNGSVFRTNDGGQTWARKTAIPGAPADVVFTGAETGLAATSAGGLYRTIDGGGSWTLVKSHPLGFTSLHFVDASVGYAVGPRSSVFKTVDGGATWTEKASDHPLDFTGIRCADALVCLITVAGGDRLIRTVDGGANYSSVTAASGKLSAASFASATRAVAAGTRGATVHSNDAGETWSPVGGALAASLTRLRATTASLAFAAGSDGALARTSDGGVTWTLLGVSTSQDVLDASFPSQNVGYALDTAGAVLKSDNAGASWQILNTGTTARPTAILALDPSHVLLIGPHGVRRSADAGSGFTSVRGALRRALLLDFDRAGSAVFTWGRTVLFVSTNGGKSWKKVRRPSRRTNLVSIDFVGPRLGFALTLDGRVWLTRNRGRRWRELPGAATGDGLRLAFSSPRNGYLSLRRFAGDARGYLLRTNDGGKSWRPELVANDSIQHDGIAATGDRTALLLSDDGSLFATTSGGDAGTVSTLTLRTSKRKLRKRQSIKVTGKLSPAEGGEQVVISIRSAGGGRWVHRTVTVAANGTFTTSWKVKTSTYFVAQWAGDDDRDADGSSLLAVKLGKRR